jgi:hypothetical protein
VTEPRPLHVSADFNELDEDNQLYVLPRQADRPAALRAGASVLLRDDEGSTMLGNVVGRARGLAVIQVLPETWHNPLAPQPSAAELTAPTTTTTTSSTSTTCLTVVGPYRRSRWDWVQSVSGGAPATAVPTLAGH